MDDILSEIEAFCEAHSLKPSAFGRLAANDTMLIPQLRKGRELRRRTVTKVRHFMATYGSARAA
jgi:hypothetical protein